MVAFIIYFYFIVIIDVFVIIIIIIIIIISCSSQEHLRWSCHLYSMYEKIRLRGVILKAFLSPSAYNWDMVTDWNPKFPNTISLESTQSY